MSSCSFFFSDGYINSLTKIDINTIKDIIRNNIIRECSELIKDIDKRSSDIDTSLDILFDKINLEKEQNTFIDYNKFNIEDKSKLVNKTAEDFEKNENDINVKQTNFSNFLEKNKNNDKKNKLYYNIIIGLIVTIVIFGIFNIFITEF